MSDNLIEKAETAIDNQDYGLAVTILNDPSLGSDVYALNLLGYSLYKDGRYAKAIDAFNRLGRDILKMPNVLFIRGRCFLHLDHLFDARSDFENALLLDSTAFDAVLGLAAIAESLDESGAARGYYERALALVPDNEMALRGIARLSGE